MSGTVRFTEEMTGFAWPGAGTYRDGWDQGKAEAWTLMFHLTIWVDDLDAFLADPDKTAVADGWVGCPGLGGRHPVERGVFNLFVPSDDPKRSNMRYRLWFRDGGGAPVHPRRPQGHRGPCRPRHLEGHDDAVHHVAGGPCRGG